MSSNTQTNKKKLYSVYYWRDLYTSASQQATIDQIENWFDYQPESGLAWYYNLASKAAEEEGRDDDFPSHFGWMLEQGTLDFSEYDEPLHDLTPLEIFTEVEHLVIKVIPDADLSPIGNLTNLVKLDIRNAVNGDYAFLEKLTKLKALEFSHCKGGLRLDSIARTQITSIRGYPDNNLIALANAQSLEDFCIFGSGVKKNPGMIDISPLKNIKNLKKIHIFYNDYVDESVIGEFSSECKIENYKNIYPAN